METYHFVLCTLLLFIQEEMEGFQTTIICWLLVFIDSLLFRGVSSLGFNFYETVMLVDLVFILLTCSIYSCHKNIKVIGVFVLSLFLNITMLQITDEVQYSQWLPWYKGLNVILFELLIWYCIVTSKIYPYLLGVSSWVDNKLGIYMSKRFKLDN